MNIFVPGAYTWGNKGDAALVVGFLDWLRTDYAADHIEITSFTPELDGDRYGVPAHHMVVRPMAIWRRAADFVASRIPGLRHLLSRYRLACARISYVWLPVWVVMYRRAPRVASILGARSLWRLTRSIDRADFVFTVPGGYLLAPREVDDWWLYHVPNIYLAKALGKSVVLGPSSIGPFATGHKRAAAKLLSYVDLIVLREELSRSFLSELGVNEDIVTISPDIAFRHRPGPMSNLGEAVLEQIAQLRRDEHGGVVGVSVRHHTFPGSLSPEADFARYIDAVESTLVALSGDGAQVVIFSQTEEDWVVSNLLSDALSSRGIRHLLADRDLTPSDLQRLYGEIDLLIGTRMHANILALTMGTPVVAIAYEPKTMGILQSIGLSEWGVWIDEVRSDSLLEISRAAWKERGPLRFRVQAAQGELQGRFAEIADQVRTRLRIDVDD